MLLTVSLAALFTNSGLNAINFKAIDEGKNFPLGAPIIDFETYLDDTISNGHTLKETLSKQSDLIKICKSGCTELHK